jgi:hypothetical protein
MYMGLFYVVFIFTLYYFQVYRNCTLAFRSSIFGLITKCVMHDHNGISGRVDGMRTS